VEADQSSSQVMVGFVIAISILLGVIVVSVLF
jgi:hypothetical protein